MPVLACCKINRICLGMPIHASREQGSVVPHSKNLCEEYSWFHDISFLFAVCLQIAFW